jgi:hypothetical protein
VTDHYIGLVNSDVHVCKLEIFGVEVGAQRCVAHCDSLRPLRRSLHAGDVVDRDLTAQREAALHGFGLLVEHADLVDV